MEVMNYFPYAIIDYVAAAIMFALAFYTYKLKKESPAVRMFSILSILVGLWSFLSATSMLLVMKYPQETYSIRDMPVIVDESSFFVVSFIGVVALHTVLANMGMLKREIKKYLPALYVFPVISSIGLIAGFITGSGFFHDTFYINESGGYVAERTSIFYYYLTPYNYAFIFAAIAVVVYRFLKPRYAVEKQRAAIFLTGIVIGMIANIIQVTMHPFMFDITPLSFFAVAIVFSIGVKKYGIFIVEPQRETPAKIEGEKEEAKEETIAPGSFVELKEEEGFNLFRRLVREGYYGMLFSTYTPDEVKKKYGFEKTLVFQFSDTPGRDCLVLSRKDHLELFDFMVKEFMKENSQSVVLIDGVGEFLDEKEVEKEVKSLKEFVTERGVGVIIAVKREA